MVSRYKDFIKEGIDNEYTDKQIIKILVQIYGINKKNIIINNGKVNLFEDISICFNNQVDKDSLFKNSGQAILKHAPANTREITKLPFSFDIVHGNFNCSSNYLTTLEGCPSEVYNHFVCSHNLLTSLEYGPKKVDGGYNCCHNKLTSLEGVPEKINGSFLCQNNKLDSFDGGPKEVGLHYYCENNRAGFEDYPLCIIRGNIVVYYEGSLTADVISASMGEDIQKKYDTICEMVKENEEIFSHLLDDKIKFHQMVMRLEPKLMKYYHGIPHPSKKSNLLI